MLENLDFIRALILLTISILLSLEFMESRFRGLSILLLISMLWSLDFIEKLDFMGNIWIQDLDFSDLFDHHLLFNIIEIWMYKTCI